MLKPTFSLLTLLLTHALFAATFNANPSDVGVNALRAVITNANLNPGSGEIIFNIGNSTSYQENGIKCAGSSNIIEGNTTGLSISSNESANTFLTSGNQQHGILLWTQASGNRIGSFISLKKRHFSRQYYWGKPAISTPPYSGKSTFVKQH